jgi:hypothetical protein
MRFLVMGKLSIQSFDVVNYCPRRFTHRSISIDASSTCWFRRPSPVDFASFRKPYLGLPSIKNKLSKQTCCRPHLHYLRPTPGAGFGLCETPALDLRAKTHAASIVRIEAPFISTH